MKGIVYAVAVGILTGRLFSPARWEFYAIIIGTVTLANVTDYLWDKRKS